VRGVNCWSKGLRSLRRPSQGQVSPSESCILQIFVYIIQGKRREAHEFLERYSLLDRRALREDFLVWLTSRAGLLSESPSSTRPDVSHPHPQVLYRIPPDLSGSNTTTQPGCEGYSAAVSDSHGLNYRLRPQTHSLDETSADVQTSSTATLLTSMTSIEVGIQKARPEEQATELSSVSHRSKRVRTAVSERTPCLRCRILKKKVRCIFQPPSPG
jgi:hypothetical protein